MVAKSLPQAPLISVSELIKVVTHQERINAPRSQQKFTKWVSEQILQSDTHRSLSGIMIWPFSLQEPQYRDNYPRYVAWHVRPARVLKFLQGVRTRKLGLGR